MRDRAMRQVEDIKHALAHINPKHAPSRIASLVELGQFAIRQAQLNYLDACEPGKMPLLPLAMDLPETSVTIQPQQSTAESQIAIPRRKQGRLELRSESTIAPDQLYSPAEAAQILNLSVKALEAWRHSSRVDLPFIRPEGGRSVRYKGSDLLEFMVRNRVGSPG